MRRSRGGEDDVQPVLEGLSQEPVRLVDDL